MPDYEIEIKDNILTLRTDNRPEYSTPISEMKVTIREDGFTTVPTNDALRSIAYPFSDNPPMDTEMVGLDLLEKKRELIAEHPELWASDNPMRPNLKVPKAEFVDAVARAICKFDLAYNMMPDIARARAVIKYDKKIGLLLATMENCAKLIGEEMASFGVKIVGGLSPCLKNLETFDRRHRSATIDRYEKIERRLQDELTDGLLARRRDTIQQLVIDLQQIMKDVVEVKNSLIPDMILQILQCVGIDHYGEDSSESIKRALVPSRSQEKREKMKNPIWSGDAK